MFMHYFNELRDLFQMVQVLYSIVYNNVHDFRLIIYFCTILLSPNVGLRGQESTALSAYSFSGTGMHKKTAMNLSFKSKHCVSVQLLSVTNLNTSKTSGPSRIHQKTV